MMKDTLALAVASTYDLVMATGVTAHPARAPYPRFIPDYVVPIRKGGALEWLYTASILEARPNEIDRHRGSLSPQAFTALESYVTHRRNTYGFRDEVYRFYILRPFKPIPGHQVRKGIQVSVMLDSAVLLAE